ncbi:MAG: cation:H+ antiporter [Cellvibrionaceae bacterium]|jgi:cation:H+ antiporter
MLTALFPWGAILLGFIGLVWSADRFVEGSVTIAGNLGISKLIIGLTVVAFGTSAPEVLVSISSSFKDAGELAVGNAIGSNLANVGMVLGLTALIVPLPVKDHILKQEFLVMLLVMGISGVFLWDAQLQFWEGLVLVILLAPLIFWIAYDKKRHPEEIEEVEMLPLKAGAFWFMVGIIALIFSAEILVWGAQKVALSLGVSPMIIGLTVVAVGTSLPELAASITSALKGHHDIAIGNVLGSNMFNLLLVMGIAPLINPIVMDHQVFTRDFAAMILITLLLGLFMWIGYSRNKQAQIGKFSGGLLLLFYIGYYFVLI